jgi:Flp pilus assembly CpaF family ATPase
VAVAVPAVVGGGMIENGRVTVEAPPQTALPELLLVARMIDGARQQPQALGLHASTAERLAADPDFRSRVHRGAVVLASCIHPLSRLVYLGDGLEEVHVNRWDKWVLTRGGQKAILGREGNPFRNNEQVLTFFRERVIQLPGFQGDRQLNEGHPIAEGNLGTLLRCCVVQRPAVTGDSSVIATVRLPTAVTIRALDDYVTQGCMPFGVAQFLAACVAGKVNLIIAGGTATGKTTLLRVLCGMIPPVEQVLVIEDSAELHLEHDRGDGRQWHPLAQQICTVAPTTSDAADAGVSMRQLVRTALRLRPDRIILGEARDSAMAEACSAATTGHAGSMVSIHADGYNPKHQYACELANGALREDQRRPRGRCRRRPSASRRSRAVRSSPRVGAAL